jgi:hypothetical protein
MSKICPLRGYLIGPPQPSNKRLQRVSVVEAQIGELVHRLKQTVGEAVTFGQDSPGGLELGILKLPN